LRTIRDFSLIPKGFHQFEESSRSLADGVLAGSHGFDALTGAYSFLKELCPSLVVGALIDITLQERVRQPIEPFFNLAETKLGRLHQIGFDQIFR
jgi:hypothetical protein